MIKLDVWRNLTFRSAYLIQVYWAKSSDDTFRFCCACEYDTRTREYVWINLDNVADDMVESVKQRVIGKCAGIQDGKVWNFTDK